VAQGTQVIEVRGVRAVIAARMTASRQSIPEASCGRWVDATDLMDRVAQLRAAHEAPLGPALTPFALILRYVVSALRRHPLLNATFDAASGSTPTQIRTFDAIHLGVAVADERGLMVPVVRHAEQLSTGALALETRRLIAAVRQGQATPSELTGSTFTVSNFGALGLDDGNPIINAPEAAILGIGAIKARPAVVGDAVVARTTAKLTCAFDHRICDGAEAGGFLADLARMIEHPDLAVIDL
jgi:pyruvate dehydrogenase E2 component (dihydrolipoamide acetyltransferase)